MRGTIIRLCLSALAGLIVVWITAAVFLADARAITYSYSWELYITRKTLEEIPDAIEGYRKKHGQLPEKLSQAISRDDLHPPLVEDAGQIFDAWGRAFVYEVTGDSYRVRSFGRDGKLGGRGLDYDISSVDPLHPEGQITFAQIVEFPSARMLVVTCVLAGLGTFTICWVMGVPTDFTPVNIARYVFAFGIIIVASILFASFLAIFHIPSGH